MLKYDQIPTGKIFKKTRGTVENPFLVKDSSFLLQQATSMEDSVAEIVSGFKLHLLAEKCIE